MERTLNEAGIVPFRSVAATRGGIDDRGVGMSKQGRALLDAAIARNGLRRIEPTSLADAIQKRIELFDELAGDRAIKAYVNIGGGSASVGTHVGKKQFRPGVNKTAPRGQGVVDSVMLRFVHVVLWLIGMIVPFGTGSGHTQGPQQQQRNPDGFHDIAVVALYCICRSSWCAGGSNTWDERTGVLAVSH